ncbi:MAG: hypothetical protein Ta2A_18690 [Treponemataceae bacterium]|nr:MAG: hypothetical protein Ta2A_18690 [Treponemataceae bacterium]
MPIFTKPKKARAADELRVIAKKLSFEGAALAQSLKNGAFSSLKTGRGLDFAGVREYSPLEDDSRFIDWRVTARMPPDVHSHAPRPFVKIYTEEKQLSFFLLIDVSKSVLQDEALKNACFASAGLLAFAAEHLKSPLGYILFDGSLRTISQTASRQNEALRFLTELEKVFSLSAVDSEAGADGATGGSALKSALIHADKLLSHNAGAAVSAREKNLLFIISDFRTVGWQNILPAIAAKHNICAVKLASPFEKMLPNLGLIPVRDSESGKTALLQTYSKQFLRRHKDEAENRDFAHMEACKKNRIRTVNLRPPLTATAICASLRAQFS